MMDPVTAVFVEAKKILEEEEVEWCQRVLFERDEELKILSACTMGVLSLATDKVQKLNDYAHPLLLMQAEKRLKLVLGDDRTSAIPIWNDRFETTKEDVLLLFKRAIEAE